MKNRSTILTFGIALLIVLSGMGGAGFFSGHVEAQGPGPGNPDPVNPACHIDYGCGMGKDTWFTGPNSNCGAYKVYCVAPTWCTDVYYSAGCSAAAAPTAFISSNPSTITAGNSSAVTWSSNNAVSCTGTNFNTGGATSGTVSVQPGSTTTYSVSCANSSGNAASANTTVTVTAPPQPTASISASPTTITQGGSSTLTWSSTNANTCSGSNFNTGNAPSGSVTVTPSSTTSYNVTCSGPGGSKTSNTVTVTVNPPANNPPTGNLDYASCSTYGGWAIDFDTINSAIAVHFYMDGGFIGGVTANQYRQDLQNAFGSGGHGFTFGVPSQYQTTGTHSVTAYAIDSQNGPYNTNIGTISYTCSPPPPVARLSVSPSTVTQGQGVTMNYSCQNSTGANILSNMAGDSYGTVPGTSGSVGWTPQGTGPRTYTLTCYGNGTAQDSASVTVTAPPPTATISANPSSITPGGSSTLTWSSTNANACSGSNFDTGTASAGSRSVAPSSTTNYNVICSGPGGVVTSNTVTVTVTAAPQPDLTSQGPSSGGNGAAGQSMTFVGPISNIGTGSASNFPNLLEVRTIGGGFVANIAAGTASLAAGQTTTASGSYTFASEGSYAVRFCADMNTSGIGSIAESNEGNNCGDWTPVTISATPAADLTPGTVFPVSAQVSVATTFAAPVINLGSASTGSGFTNLLQKANNAAGGGATDVATSAMGAVASSGSSSAVFSYTFPGGDGGSTKYLRVCADKSAATDGGVISESNENNNCGAWTAVSVAAQSAQPTLSCVASPNSGASLPANTTWTASVGGFSPTTYTWTPSEGGGPIVTASPTLPRSYSTAGNYGMSVVASNGSTSVPASCSTFAAAACSGAAGVSIVANPSRVQPDRTTSLAITTANIAAGTSCSVTGNNGFSTSITPNSCSYTAPTIQTSPITRQTVFTVTCPGAAPATAVVNVVPRYTEF
jgi:hypothetical protein